MANTGVNVPVSVSDNTKQGWRSVYATATAQQEQLQKYLTLVPLINTKAFETQYKRLEKMTQTLNQESKWSGKTLTKVGKKGWTYDLQGSMTGSLDELRQAMSDIKKEWTSGKFKGAKGTLAQEWLKEAESLEKTWARVNSRAEKYAHVDKAAARDKEASRVAREREKAEGRILTYQHTIDKYKQNMSNYDGQLYRNVQKRLTAEQQIASALRMQEEIYRQVGEKKKAAIAAGQATKWENKAAETSSQLENWTGNEKGLIATWTPENLKRQLNAVSRDITNTIGRENVLSLKLNITGWEQDVARLRNAAKDVEKTFTLGGRKFKIAGYDDAVKALTQIDKLAEKGIKGASAWQQKINNYLQAHVAVANAYQTHQNKIIENQKREAKESEKLNAGLLKQGRIIDTLKNFALRYFSLFTVVNIGKKIAETTGYFQQQQTALEGILKSASRAQEAITEIKSMALKSPFETKDIVTQTKQLAAYGIEYEKLLPTVKQLGDLSTGLGVDMSRLVLAFGQVKSASVLRGQELRQFTEAGVPMVDALAKKFTELNGKLITTADIFEMISRRQVSFEMVNSVLTDMTAEGGKFYNMQEKMTDTLYGQIQKLKDLWTLSLNETGSAITPTLMKVVKALQSATKHMSGIITGGALAYGLKMLGEMLFKLGLMVRQTALFTTNWSKAVTIMRTGNTLARRMVGFLSIMKGLSGIFSVISIAAGVIAGKIMDMRQAAKEFKREIENIESSFAKQLYEQTEGLDKLVGKLATSIKGTRDYERALETLKTNYGEYINPAIIDQLIKERQAINATGEAWSGLRDSIVAAMRAKMDYEMYGAKGTAASSKLRDTFSPNDVISKVLLERTVGNTQQETDVLWNKFLGKYGINPVKFRDNVAKMNTIINVATENFFNNLESTPEQFAKELDEQAKMYSPELRKAIQAMSTDLFAELISKKEIWNEYTASLGLQNASPYKKTRDAFDKVEKEQRQGSYFVKTGNAEIDKAAEYAYNPFKTSNEIGAGYMKAILTGKNGLLGQFSNLQDEDLTEEGKNIWKSQYKTIREALIKYSKDFQIDAIKEVSDDFMLLANSIKNSQLRGIIVDLVNELQTRIAALSNDEARIANRLRANYGANTSYSVDTKDFMARYTPTKAGDFERIRKQLISDYKEAQDEIDSYKDKTGEWAPRIKELRDKQNLLKILGSSQYYNIDVTGTKTSRTGGSKGNWAQFLNGFIDLIKTASNSEKQLVEGVDGYTTKLYEDIDKLEDSPLKDFYNAGTNPFEKYLQTIKDYDLEGFFKKEDFDKLTTKFLEDVGPENIDTADYRTIWKDLIQIMSDKVDTTANASDKERLKSVLRNMEKEFETFFGKQEIDSLIANAIKELVDINRNTEKLGNQDKLFKEFAPLIGFRQASRIIKGTDYSTFDPRTLAESNLRSLMSRESSKGFAASDPGMLLKNIMDSTSINLDNLAQLNDVLTLIETEIQKRSLEAKGSKKATQEVEQFKGIANLFKTAINNMVSAIKDKTTEIVNAMSEEERAALNVDAALQSYIDKLNLINESADKNGTEVRFKERAQIQATQSLYDTIAKNIGGPAINEYIKEVFGSSKTSTGVTTGGLAMQYLFGGMSFADIIKTAMTTDLSDYIKSETERIDKIIDPDEKAKDLDNLKNSTTVASQGLQKFSGVVGFITSIAEVLANMLNGIFDVLEKNLEYLDSWSKVVKDEYGNYTNLFSDYTSDQRSKASVAKQFLNDFIPLKALSEGDIFGVINFLPNAIMGLFKNLNILKDQKTQKTQDKLISANEKLVKSMDDLTFALEDTAGKDKFDNKYQQIANLQQQQTNYETLLALEQSKKNGDASKAEEYKQAANDAKNKQASILSEIQNEIFSFADEVAATLTDAFVEAFRNGTNAARAWRDAVKSYVSDILKEQLLQNVVAPRIQKILNAYGINNGESSDSIINALSDPDRVTKFVNQLNTEGDWMVDWLGSLPQEIQDLIGYKSSDSSLSGGMESITEDTARRLEALMNSQLGEVVLIRLNSDDILLQTESINQHIANVATDIGTTKTYVESIKNIMTDVYDSGDRALKVIMQ